MRTTPHASGVTGRDLADRSRWSDFSVRVASALVLGPVSLAAIWAGGAYWAVLLSVLAVIAAIEWGGICNWRRRDAGTITAGVLYVALAWLSLLALRMGAAGRGNLLFVIAVVWAADIGAYAAGRMIGGPKLWPSLSPSKTWAGAAGGILSGIAAGVIVAAVVEGGIAPGAFVTAAALTIAAQIGDLAESALKRRYQKKDSGWLIPGHGGVLDRVDGLLAAAPIGYLLAAEAGSGAFLWR